MSKLIRSRMDVSPLRVRAPRDREEYMTLLRAKLLEEAYEAHAASAFEHDQAKVLDELADVFEVVLTLAHAHGRTIDDVEQAAANKAATRGDFHEFDARVYT